mmetsp:Transcript_39992/g.97292  ORF Transcript_39992/g.97292 Transcript_39992/m.97292 type:complete len:262 (-) Transcript_39992:266-1051(-)
MDPHVVLRECLAALVLGSGLDFPFGPNLQAAVCVSPLLSLSLGCLSERIRSMFAIERRLRRSVHRRSSCEARLCTKHWMALRGLVHRYVPRWTIFVRRNQQNTFGSAHYAGHHRNDGWRLLAQQVWSGIPGSRLGRSGCMGASGSEVWAKRTSERSRGGTDRTCHCRGVKCGAWHHPSLQEERVTGDGRPSVASNSYQGARTRLSWLCAQEKLHPRLSTSCLLFLFPGNHLGGFPRLAGSSTGKLDFAAATARGATDCVSC